MGFRPFVAAATASGNMGQIIFFKGMPKGHTAGCFFLPAMTRLAMAAGMKAPCPRTISSIFS